MSDYETTQRTRNIIVGIFVVAAVCALVWLIFIFGDLPVFVSGWRSFEVRVQFPTAPGVQEDTPVRFCGYEIGSVTRVMAPEIREDLKTGLKYHQTLVVMGINRKYVNIPSNVEVKLMTRGLGSSYIELSVDPAAPLVPRDPNRYETRFLRDKMLLQGTTGTTSEFFPEESQKKLEALSIKLDALLVNVNDIIGDVENKENIKKTLANLSDASDRASDALEEFQEFFAAAVGTSEELAKTASELRLILGKINSGEGSAGMLLNDGRLYENLLENSQQMQVLLEELREFAAKSRDKGLPIKLK
ncbi:MAG: MCE family protein [Planctomycetota bacterium]|nr:MAG: MCE family protein [Planctomycetota bacterium]